VLHNIDRSSNVDVSLSGQYEVPLNLTEMVLYGADKAVIVYILYSELYRIIILPNNIIIIPSISLLPHL
jgi:hypothetical protein